MRGVTTLVLFLIGCASASLSEPQIHIHQLSNVSEAARHITGGISVQYRVEITNRANQPITINVEITNRANQPITIKRIDLVSLGTGAYTLRPSSNPFDARLNPGDATALELWAPAYIDDPTIVGANGPVSLRITVQYETPAGTSQSIVVQQVHAMPGAD